MPSPGKEASVNFGYLLWRRKYLIVFGLLLGAGLGAARAILQPPLYWAAVTMEIRGFNSKFLGLDEVDLQGGGNYGAVASDVQTQTLIMTSTAMRERAIERLSLDLTPIEHQATGIFARLRERLGLNAREPVEAMRTALTTAANSASAQSVGASRLVRISTKSTSPRIAADFVNTLASEYASQSVRARSTGAMRTIQWIEGQLEEVRARLLRAEDDLQTFLKQRGIDFVVESNTLDQSKLAQLQAELSVSQAERIDKQARWELAQSSPIDSLPEILDDGRLQSLGARLTTLREERASLAATLMPEHYRMKRIDAQIAELDEALKREKGNLVQRIRNEYDAAVERERMLSQAYGSQAGRIAGKADQSAEFARLTREVKAQQAVHDLLSNKLNDAYLAAAVPAEAVRVVEPARPSEEAVEPQPARDIVLGSVLCGGAVFGICFLVESRRQRKLATVFSGPGHVNESLSLPELGVIPAIEEPARRSWRNVAGGKTPSVRDAVTGKARVRLIVGRPAQAGSTELVARDQALSLLAESFRLTLTSIMAPRGWDWRPAIVLTSPGPGEGKTTVASNLAVAVAQSNRSVVLVDADWRKPSLHKTFQHEREPGLADWLLDAGTGGLKLDDCLRTTDIPGLTLMPAGRRVDEDSGQIAFSGQFAGLLSALRTRFDVVLLDTAPALHFADARLLAALTDGVVFVIRAGSTARESAQRLGEQFRADRIPILGTILNDWRPMDSAGNAYAEQYQAYQRAYEADR